jgi:hypothetical protein
MDAAGAETSVRAPVLILALPWSSQQITSESISLKYRDFMDKIKQNELLLDFESIFNYINNRF